MNIGNKIKFWQSNTPGNSDVSKQKPPEIKPKSSVARRSYPTGKTGLQDAQTNIIPDTEEKKSEDGSKDLTGKQQLEADENDYLVPNPATADSDEYVKVEIGKQNPTSSENEGFMFWKWSLTDGRKLKDANLSFLFATHYLRKFQILGKKAEHFRSIIQFISSIISDNQEVYIEAAGSSESKHLHIHIHLYPPETQVTSNKPWKVFVKQSCNKEATQKITTKESPSTPVPPPRTPPRTYKNRESTLNEEQESTNDKSDSHKSDSDTEENEKEKKEPKPKMRRQESYEEINYGGAAAKDSDSSMAKNRQSEGNLSGQKDTESTGVHCPWLFKHTETTRAEESLQTDMDGSFAVIQEDTECKPLTPYTLMLVHNEKLKHIPVMKTGTKPGKDTYSLADSKYMKSIEELITYFQTHEIKGLNVKLRPSN